MTKPPTIAKVLLYAAIALLSLAALGLVFVLPPHALETGLVYRGF